MAEYNHAQTPSPEFNVPLDSFEFQRKRTKGLERTSSIPPLEAPEDKKEELDLHLSQTQTECEESTRGTKRKEPEKEEDDVRPVSKRLKLSTTVQGLAEQWKTLNGQRIELQQREDEVLQKIKKLTRYCVSHMKKGEIFPISTGYLCEECQYDIDHPL